MHGQGSPTIDIFSRCQGLPWRGVVLCALLFFTVLFPTTLSGAEIECRLRLAWGGEANAWEGLIHLSTGEILAVTPLGLEADVPGSLLRTDRGVELIRRSPRSYDGCDLTLKADEKALLFIDFSRGTESAKRIEIPLAKVLKSLQSFPLDDRGSRLLAQRAPGDTLRVELDREHLVFAPGEKLALRVQPHWADLPASSTVVLQLQVTAGRSEQELFSQQRELKTDAQGNVPQELLEVDIPAQEGVYDLKFSLQPKRFASSLTPITPAIVRPKPLLERKVQIVVVAPEAPKAKTAGSWQVELEIDPTSPHWWERLPRLPSLKVLPSFASGPVGNAKPMVRSHLNRNLTEIASETWQAYPLTTTRVGEPHLLEVEYPSDVPQTLSISIIEPNAAGQVVPLGLDSGIVVSEPGPGHNPKIEKHRLIFWPQTKTPVALLANRRGDRPAIYGKVRILSGVNELEPLALPDAGVGRRKFIAYFDKPIVPEAFAGDEALDPLTRRNLDDWLTFQRSGRRMIEYLKHAGYSAAVIPALCEGSMLYPSQRQESTPNYDNGIFFETGQDPVQKDVIELYFRLFNRAGLELFPALQLTSPLTELEQLRRTDPTAASGLEPIGPDGQSWLARYGSRRGQGVYYNPLDPRVQKAIRNLVGELAERYREHPAFGGLALNLSHDSYLLFPDELLSLDDTTISRFSQETGITLPQGRANRFAERAQLLRGQHRAAWLEWRSEKLKQFQADLQKELQTHRPNAQLIFTGSELFADRIVQQTARPMLPAVRLPSAPWLHLGLQTPAMQARGPMLPRPQRFSPNAPTGLDILSQYWNESAEVDGWFTEASSTMMFHDPAPLRLTSFDELGPFGKDKTHCLLLSHFAPAGASARRRFVHNLAVADVEQVIDGGWMPIFGQEEAIRPWVEIFRQLPAVEFQTHTSAAKQANATPVVVRSHSEGGKTWLYVVNDSPWPSQVELQLRTGANPRWESLGALRGANIQPVPGGLRYSVTLEPYDLSALRLVGTGIAVDNWQSQPAAELEPWLRERVRDTRLRVNSLRTPQPLTTLENPSFEQPVGNSIPQWSFASGEGIRIAVDSAQGHEGRQSLRMTSRSSGGKAPVAWARSEVLPTPQTGRLSLLAWIRCENPEQQPKLRLAVEGKWDGKPYYRLANVGLSEDGLPTKPLKREWAAYRLSLADLPLSGLTDLRVGFDLMGEGDVWIDDVQLFDFWLEPHERDELLKNIASAELQLDSQQYWECQRFIDGPWPTFVRRFVSFDPSRVATAPGKSILPPPPVPAASPPANAGKGNFFNRLLPKWPLR